MGITLAISAAAASVVGTAVQVAGTIQQGKAAEAAGKYNAALAEQDRQRDIQTADIASEDKRREDTRILAANRAALGTSGFELAGSPLESLQDMSLSMSLDERRVAQEGDVKSREGFIRSQSALAEGRNARIGSYYTAAGEGLSGLGQTASGYLTATRK